MNHKFVRAFLGLFMIEMCISTENYFWILLPVQVQLLRTDYTIYLVRYYISGGVYQ